MKTILLLMGILYSSFLLATPECDYHFSLSNATIEITEGAQVIEQKLSIWRGQNSPDGRCSRYRVFFSKGLANDYQRQAKSIWGRSLNYNLHKSVNQVGILKDINDAVNSNEFLEGVAPHKFTTYRDEFFISVPGLKGSNIVSGLYYDNLQVTIYGYNESSGKYLFEETTTFTFLTFIPKRVQVSIIDEGGSFDPSSTSKTLDFGLLSQNQEKSADIRVVSNGSYRLKLSSQNNSKLKQGQGETIAYSLNVNGNNVSLATSSANPVTIGSGGTTSEAGDRYNLRIKILENTTHKSAGVYQDAITITAIAN